MDMIPEITDTVPEITDTVPEITITINAPMHERGNAN